MARIDALPAEQRAVLQLVLKQGKSYGELANLLHTDEESVRQRAHAATAALGPPETPGLTGDRRDEITDWLLGQGDPERREATRALLAAWRPGREWAKAIVEELTPLGTERVLAIPEPREPELAPPAQRASGASTPRVSRRGGALLIAAAVVVIGVVLVVLLSGGGSSNDKGTNAADTTSATPTTSTTSRTTILAHANLTAPSGAPAKNAIGLVQIVDVSGQRAINAVVQGLKQGKKSGYGIWLYASPSKEKWLGYFSTKDQQGRLIAQGRLDVDPSLYRQILVTRESSRNPPRPSTIYLAGPIQSGQ